MGNNNHYQVEKTCEVCGKTFIAKKINARFCSQRCQKRAFYKRREEERQRMELPKEIQIERMELPKEIQIGGQVLTTQICEDLGGKLGRCCCYNGYIKIATNVDGSTQTESSMLNTYIHECVHAILDTMGRGDLSNDETFVSSFAGFATEGLVSIFKNTNWEEDI